MMTKSKTRAPQSSSLARGELRRGLLIPGRKPICSRSGHVLVTCPESYPRLSTEMKATTATTTTTTTKTETTRTRVERQECHWCIHGRHVYISAFISAGYSWSNDWFYCSLFSEITCYRTIAQRNRAEVYVNMGIMEISNFRARITC